MSSDKQNPSRLHPTLTGTMFGVLLLAGTMLANPAQAAKPDPSKPTASAAAKPAVVKIAALKSGGPTGARLQSVNAGLQTSLNSLQARGRTTGAGANGLQRRAAAYRSVAQSQYRGGISCVPYARSVTGMAVSGNAWQWWASAAGTYERGARPESGSVLNFRSTGRMSLGHVAVVSGVIDSREITIDHANWAGGGISRGVRVMDVSEGNDWSAVRVSLGNNGAYGSVYPTYGFIYNRPDHGTMLANSLAHPRILPRLEEVAQAPSAAPVARLYSESLGGR